MSGSDGRVPFEALQGAYRVLGEGTIEAMERDVQTLFESAEAIVLQAVRAIQSGNDSLVSNRERAALLAGAQYLIGFGSKMNAALQQERHAESQRRELNS